MDPDEPQTLNPKPSRLWLQLCGPEDGETAAEAAKTETPISFNCGLFLNLQKDPECDLRTIP